MTTVNVTAVNNTVTITEGNAGTTVVKIPQTSIIETLTAGPQGPPGSGAYIFTQTSPSTTWVINHNFGFFPSVELMDAGSQEIEGQIVHTSINQTVVTLNPAVAGIARLT